MGRNQQYCFGDRDFGGKLLKEFSDAELRGVLCQRERATTVEKIDRGKSSLVHLDLNVKKDIRC